MKKIGFVYNYNPSEKKGILVYGKWKIVTDDGFFKKTLLNDLPIVFSDEVCLGEIRQGQLVYFKLDEDGNAFEIERASLANFDIELVKFLITADNERQYVNNTTIAYEDLKEKFDGHCNPTQCNIEDLVKSFGIVRERIITRPGRSKRIVQCWNDSINLNIMDLSIWVDKEIISNQNYYGQNLEEVLFLYDLFVQRIRISSNGNKRYLNNENDLISPIWPFLLAKLSNDDLRKIIRAAPKLQPVLPVKFCEDNLDVLNDKYGMPTKDLCKDYCTYKVSTISTATDYKEWSQKLYLFANCNTNHLHEEGVPMCSMGKEYIMQLENNLEKNYINQIEINIINSLNSFLGTGSLNSVNELSKVELLNIGVFLDALYKFRTSFLTYNNYRWKREFKSILKLYETLNKNLKDLLSSAWRNFVNESLLELSTKADLSPLTLGFTVELVVAYIDDKTKSEIMAKVNDTFSKAFNISDLTYALEYGYISKIQFLGAIMSLTENYTTTQFACFITDSGFETRSLRFAEMPLDVQKYILNRIVEVYGAKELHKGESVRISDYNGFCNLESFIRWLTELKSGQYGGIKHEAIESAISKAIEPLNEQDIEYLFNKRYLVKPGDPIETILSKYCAQVARDMEYQNYIDSLYEDDSYGQYSGSWAQDVEGYSDDDIDTIFDSDPDAYWNID